jgi:hypothetical protein
MGEIFTDLGIQHIQAIWPKNGGNDATMYVGLFGSLTSGTVPVRDITGGVSPAGWTEVTGWAYARQIISAAQWGISAINGNGLKITGIQLTFPTATGTWSVANGMFLATNVSSMAGDVPIYFANFDDLTNVQLNSGDVIRCTPGIQFDG